jgi:cell division protein FtsN
VNMKTKKTFFAKPVQQRGGVFLGVIIGLLLGLAAALAVAVYVTKVPVPFMNKGATKTTAEQDAQESQKNKNWDPNAPLYGKNPAKPSASGTVGTATATTGVLPPVAAASAPKGAASAPKTAASAPKATASAATAAKPSADPLGDLAKAKTAGTATAAVSGGADPFTYFVQAGAFRTPEDAEAQKAKLVMAGFEAKITEREQSGRTVFRVRVGPMDKQTDANSAKEKLDGAGFETAIVRVQR